MASTATPAVTDPNAAGRTSFDFLNSKNPVPSKGYTAQEQNDRFIRLLTTQLKNQDPLNPMDNAQMTTQMAQISTVSGMEKLNGAIESLSGRFMQMQAMQGASLVGRDIAVSGDRLVRTEGGGGAGRFALSVPADTVSVDVMTPAGTVVATRNLGAQANGDHTFQIDMNGLDPSTQYRFRINAAAGRAPVTAQTQTINKVVAVHTEGSKLMLELDTGKSVAYDDVKAML